MEPSTVKAPTRGVDSARSPAPLSNLLTQVSGERRKTFKEGGQLVNHALRVRDADLAPRTNLALPWDAPVDAADAVSAAELRRALVAKANRKADELEADYREEMVAKRER